MRRTSRKVFLVAWLLGVSLSGWAANPSLDAYERGIDDPSKHSKALRLANLELKVDLVGAIADTTVTARFENGSDDTLEGRFSFELPEGAVVTGYALDIEGTMIDGVLVDPLKARREYQERVRERVDPGVANVSRANVFSTTVYPIPDHGSRTIRLRFSAPIHAERGYAFPLETRAAVGNFSIDMRADGVTSAPGLTLPNDTGAKWQPSAGGFTLAARLPGQALKGALRIAPVISSAPALASRHASGKTFFQIVDRTASASAAAPGKRVRVYWDRSLSRRDDLLEDELDLLDKFLAQTKPQSVDLVVFNSSGARVQRTAPGGVRALLSAVLYRGATSVSVLENLNAPAADLCLVFSDGVVTIDPRREFNPGCEVSAISSAPDADRGFLKRLTRGGPVLSLDRQGEQEILARLAGTGPRVIEARSEDGKKLPFAALDGGAAGWAVVGEAPAKGAVILRVAGLSREIVERRYSLVDARSARFAGAGALWAVDRVASLGAEDFAHAELVKVSRQFSVASPALSFIVLENPSDYVEADIAPPANYPKEALAEYRELKAGHDQEKKQAADTRLAEVIEQWEEQKRWWNTKFGTQRRKQLAMKSAVPAIAGASQAAAAPAPRATEQASGVVDSIVASDVGAFPNNYQAEALQRVRGNELQEVMVTGMRASDESPTAISVDMENWSPDRPYLKALDAAAPERVDRVLAREERKNAELPAFYFDVAEWLYRKKRTAEAIEMLLSALELTAANEQTVSMVADRLLRFGRIDRAIWLYERAREQSDYLPQPRRTLALALARRAATASPERARADLIRAVELLNQIVTTPWDDSFDGIELVALMDVNQLLPRLEQLGVGPVPLDQRLRALLEVDIRVFIEWNTDATDMDLWVDEPTGERAIYSHPRTDIGGRLSNDMTEGLGPEEYLLHRAIPGEYRISVNVYAADSINPNGTTIVTAHLIRNFGRENQAEETMELELLPDETGEKTIGKFRVN
jgi:tetratricopeptide (TPR) repeat protein